MKSRAAWGWGALRVKPAYATVVTTGSSRAPIHRRAFLFGLGDVGVGEGRRQRHFPPGHQAGQARAGHVLHFHVLLGELIEIFPAEGFQRAADPARSRRGADDGHLALPPSKINRSAIVIGTGGGGNQRGVGEALPAGIGLVVADVIKTVLAFVLNIFGIITRFRNMVFRRLPRVYRFRTICSPVVAITSAMYWPARISSNARLINVRPSVRSISVTLMNGYFFSNSLAVGAIPGVGAVGSKSGFFFGALDQDLFPVSPHWMRADLQSTSSTPLSAAGEEQSAASSSKSAVIIWTEDSTHDHKHLLAGVMGWELARPDDLNRKKWYGPLLHGNFHVSGIPRETSQRRMHACGKAMRAAAQCGQTRRSSLLLASGWAFILCDSFAIPGGSRIP